MSLVPIPSLLTVMATTGLPDMVSMALIKGSLTEVSRG
jgi:hypothetical protein